MKIIIAGGGLTGLSAALDLVEHEVIIVDMKQELGTPCNSPGWIENLSLIPSKLGYENNSFRRSWLEKNMAIMATQQGVDIKLKTRIIGFEDGLITSYGKVNGDIYIDALGEKSKSNLVLTDIEMLRPPSRKLIQWYGGISIGSQEWTRGDGTGETWWTENEPTENWLELMEGKHPKKLGADAAIIRGKELASRVK
jgi:flavin-dependent dehydrogenase